MQSRFTKRMAVALLVAFTLLCATAGFAQRIDGALRGTVTDQTGAVVSGAKVTATNVDTGVSFSATTNESGNFNFNNLLAGNYKIRIEAGSFSVHERQVMVSTNQVNDIRVQLSAKAAGEVVEVTEAGSLVQAETSQITNTFSAMQANNIPVANGGDVRNLAIYSPGVTAQSGGTAGQGGSVGGLRARSNSFNIDGLDDNDVSTTGGTSGVIQDAVQEFTVLTNTFSAEYGNAGGGVFNIVSKSGTNKWHGSGFIYHQDERYNALDNLEKAGGITRECPKDGSDPSCSPQSNLDFVRDGFTVGGPIKRDKIFIFGAYEYTRLAGVATGSEETPTAAGLAALTGISQNAAIADLLTAFPTAASVTRTQPVANLNTCADPADITTCTTTANVDIGEIFITVPNPTKTKQYMVNGDVNINSAQQLHMRYNLFQSRGTDVGSDLRFSGASNYDAHKASLNHIWSINSHWVNDFKVGYSRSIGPSLEGAKNPIDNRFPNITLDDLGNFSVGPAGNSPQTGFQNVYQFVDQMNLTKGGHNLKFGVEGRSYIATSSFLQRQRGDYEFSTMDQFVSDWAPDSFAARGVGRADFDGNTTYFGTFFQDDWKVTRNLTLNLGLRYDYFTVPADTRLQAFNSLATLPGTPLVFNAPRADKDNFGPRLGFAWDPFGTGKWSIRGGYAVNYDVIFQNLPLLQLPAEVQGLYNLGLACAVAVPPAWCADPNGSGFFGSGAILNVLAPIADPITARNFTTNKMVDDTHPLIQSWTFGVQHELWKNSMLEVRYLGTKGTHLPVQRILNATTMFDRGFAGLPTYLSTAEIPATVSLTAPNRAQAVAMSISTAVTGPSQRPYFADGFLGGVTEFSPLGESHYHGLSLDFTQRMWRGLTLRANYNWSKSIDNSTNELNTSTVNPRRPEDMDNLDAERGLSVFHIPHKFSALWTYQVPGLKTNGWIERLTGGWEINGGTLMQSGQYVTVQSAIDANGNGDSAGDRAIFNPAGSGLTISSASRVCRNAVTGATSVNNACSNANTVGYVANDPSAKFVIANVGVITNSGRDNVQTPGLQVWNMSIGKKTKITEGTAFEVRADMFNIFNHRNYSFGNTGVFNTNSAATDNGSFVRGFTPFFGDVKNINGGNRTITLVAKFTF